MVLCRENVLEEHGLCPRHVEQGSNVPMYRTNLPNTAVGPFKGIKVVSMRPYSPEKVAQVAEITSCYPGAHGGPIHWGDPAELGIDIEVQCPLVAFLVCDLLGCYRN